MTDLARKIESRGHWIVTVTPATYEEKRIPRADLENILRHASVDLRGWDFPHIDHEFPIENGQNWISQESTWNQFHEVWRFYRSGQFADACAIWEDWRDESQRPAPEEWRPGKDFGVGDSLFRLVEIFEFAARLSLTKAGEGAMHLSIKVRGLEGRSLLNDDPRRMGFRRRRTTSMVEYKHEKTYDRTTLVAQLRELALEPAIELFESFGWSPGIDLLREWQQRLGKW